MRQDPRHLPPLLPSPRLGGWANSQRPYFYPSVIGSGCLGLAGVRGLRLVLQRSPASIQVRLWLVVLFRPWFQSLRLPALRPGGHVSSGPPALHAVGALPHCLLLVAGSLSLAQAPGRLVSLGGCPVWGSWWPGTCTCCSPILQLAWVPIVPSQVE